jgi:hypothetical protein
LIWAGCALLALHAGCGDGELLDVGLAGASSGGTNDHEGGEGGAEAGRGQDDGGTQGSAAAAADDGGGKGGKGGKGGTGGSGTGGGDGGDAGQGASDGSGESGGAPAAAAGGSSGLGGTSGDTSLAGAGGGPPDPEQLDICLRLGDTTSLSLSLSLKFEKKVIADCRVNWVTYLYYDSSKGLNDRADFLQQLLQFNLSVWGCPLAAKPDSFDLIYLPAPLSGLDASTLIDEYVAASDEVVNLSDSEASELRTLLGNLSELLLIEPDPGDFSDSRCPTGGGGEGGGDGSGNAGQAGAP